MTENLVREHNIMLSKSVVWWEEQMMLCHTSISEIDEIIDVFGTDDRLEEQQIVWENKFKYLQKKGRFETRLLNKMEIGTKKAVNKRNAKKKRQ